MCGICAIWGENQNQNLNLLIESLKNLQHRGQESFGYATISTDNQEIKTICKEGLVRDYQLNDNILSTPFAIGHLRYSTSGNKSILGSQPITNELFSIVHNGNIPNKDKLLNFLSSEIIENIENKDFLSDTQILERYLYQELIKEKSSFPIILRNLLLTIKGVYNLIILTKKSLWIVRDSTGIRPLILAKSPNNKTIIIASESCVLSSRNFYNYQFQDILEGSITEITLEGKIINHTGILSNPTPCLFEFIYFMNPRSIVSGQSVLEFREKSGKLLANQETLDMKKYFQKHKNEIVVIGAPSTGNPSAKSYAEEMNLNYDLNILTKKSKCERTFILKDNTERRNAICDKYNYDENKIKNKIIVIVDDSLVRGNTISIINQKLRDYQAKEIHVRIASPKVKYPCLCGIDIPTKEELIANQINFSPQLIKADSLIYLSLDKIQEINPKFKYYQGCFDGIYPI